MDQLNLYTTYSNFAKTISTFDPFICCRCLNVTSSSQSLMTLDCGGIVGRTVTISHPDVPLTLCEVEIFSIWEHPENRFPQRPPSSGKNARIFREHFKGRIPVRLLMFIMFADDTVVYICCVTNKFCYNQALSSENNYIYYNWTS